MLRALGILGPKPPGNREVLLAAIPVRNELVEESRTAKGELRLKAPLRETMMKRLFGSQRREKSFELDDLGEAVWGDIDGRKSVEGIIMHFAQTQRVNAREAEVSVTAFLKTLMQRNLIALVASKKEATRLRQQERARKRR